ncbi:MAG: hypothetical protein IKJ11_11085 [Clostridia bacterium]|nr:hypothetical protein [Clostridia bacterium]
MMICGGDMYAAAPIADITSATTATCPMLCHLPRILARREKEIAGTKETDHAL